MGAESKSAFLTLYSPIIELLHITHLPLPHGGPCPTASGLALTFALTQQMLAKAELCVHRLYLLSSRDLPVEAQAPGSYCAFAGQDTPVAGGSWNEG